MRKLIKAGEMSKSLHAAIKGKPQLPSPLSSENTGSQAYAPQAKDWRYLLGKLSSLKEKNYRQ